MVEIKNIEMGVAQYLEAELVPKLPAGGWKQFGVGVVAALVARRGGAILEAYKGHPALKAFGVVDEAGCFDVDVLREIAMERIPESGLPVDVPMLGRLTIYRADVDKLYGYIVGKGVRYL